jgi:hypothetical protein
MRLREVLLRRFRQRFPQQRGDLPLDVDDRVGLVEILLRPRELALKPRVLLGERVLGRLAATLPRRQPSELALVALPPPRREVRRVEPLATQQCPDRCLSARRECFVRLPDDTELVLSREHPALRALGGGGSLRNPRARRLPDRGRCPSRGEDASFFLTDIFSIVTDSQLAPDGNFDLGRCLSHVGREGIGSTTYLKLNSM